MKFSSLPEQRDASQDIDKEYLKEGKTTPTNERILSSTWPTNTGKDSWVTSIPLLAVNANLCSIEFSPPFISP